MVETHDLPFDRERLKNEIRSTYARLAAEPGGDFHFNRGPAYAASMLGYDRAELDALPEFVTASFAGVGNPFRPLALPSAASVIDLGSGSGMDCLIAGRRVGPQGEVIGFDMTKDMLYRARAGAEAIGMRQIRFIKADISHLPLDNASVDIAISNGVISLCLDKQRVFNEVYRVLRRGGRVQFADIVIESQLSQAALDDIHLWTDRIGGALPPAGYLAALAQAGFKQAERVEYFDPFAGTSEEKTARRHGVRGANFIAYKD